MKNIFIDTSALIAARVFDDANHTEAQRSLACVREQKLVLHSSNFVMDEVYNFFLKHHSIGLELIELMQNNPLITLHRVSVEDEEQALKVLKQHPDKDFSYTDATSFAMMERLNIEVVFTFDENFRRYGKFQLFNQL